MKYLFVILAVLFLGNGCNEPPKSDWPEYDKRICMDNDNGSNSIENLNTVKKEFPNCEIVLTTQSVVGCSGDDAFFLKCK